MTERTFRRDGWDARVRIGVVVPHADVGPEAELRAMAPADVSVHAHRLHFGAMRPGGVMDPKIPHQPVTSFTDEPYLDDTVESLAASPLDVIALGFTSSSYKHGVDGEQALLRRLAPRTRGMPLVTTCLAASNAMRALGVRSMALVNPPWFDRELDLAGARYFTDQGFDVVHHAPSGLPSSQADIIPGLLFDWVKSVADGADAVFVAGNGQRAVGIVEALEDELGTAVLTANQVLLWQSLRETAPDVEVHGYGRVFRVGAFEGV
ncbi:maleate cis-trans isomerase [Saccharothrix sp. HUAS TT1]|uniref:maleate cis-trans isomerase family protein n=1 Tax=unclassified Saccharothrix TaxID=2593673 RepID=UPI00345BE89D